MTMLLVGLGGLLGALARYQIGIHIAGHVKSGFPVPTFLINLTGALLLGLVTGLDPVKNIYLLLGDGFLGAFTTFSTFMYEGVQLIRGSKRCNAAVYIGGSIVLGITGYLIGWQLSKFFAV